MGVLNDNINSLQSLLKQGLIDQDEFDQKAMAYREETYAEANRLANADNEGSLQKAIDLFRDLGSYRDAKGLVETTQRKLDDLKASKAREIKRTIAIVAGVVIAVIVALVVALVIIPNQERATAYDAAQKLYDGGDYEGAKSAFEKLGDYSDAQEKATAAALDSRRVVKGVLSKANIGDHVFMGTFDKKSSSTNNSGDIEWRVLSVEDNQVLLISEGVIDQRPFNASSSKGNDWESSDLNAWLSNSFKASAFSPEEQDLLVDNPFCLSEEEVITYFTSEADRACGNEDWWLRSPYKTSKSQVNYVQSGGSFTGVDGKTYQATPGGIGGADVGLSRGVRPAIWVKR